MKKANVFIILCLVVIIVSVAVTAYLRAHPRVTFTPSKTCITITDVTFQTGTATIYVTNMAWPFPPEEDWKVSISSVTVDGVPKTILATGGSLTGSGPYELDYEASGTITISLSWTSGNNYTFAVKTMANHHDVSNVESPYRTTAP